MDLSNIGLETALLLASILVAVGWFFWQRYQSLEKRFDAVLERIRELESKLIEQRHVIDVATLGETRDREFLTHVTESLKALIEHRTDRFCGELDRVESTLQRDLDEMKRFLESRSDYTIRRRSED